MVAFIFKLPILMPAIVYICRTKSLALRKSIDSPTSLGENNRALAPTPPIGTPERHSYRRC